jgi:hypothetical protein
MTKRLVSLLCLLLPGGCFLLETSMELAGSTPSDWYEIGPVKKPLEVVTQTTHDLITRQGYKVAEFNSKALELETEWKAELSPHWREGFRTMIEVEFEDMGDEGIKVSLRSYRQFNDESKQPMVLEEANWLDAGIDQRHAEKIPNPAMRLHFMLKHKLVGLKLDE